MPMNCCKSQAILCNYAQSSFKDSITSIRHLFLVELIVVVNIDVVDDFLPFSKWSEFAKLIMELDLVM